MKRLLIILLLLAPVALPGLAHASPPDPTWIQGIYDDDDGDSIVTLIASGTGHAPEAASDRSPALRPADRPPDPDARADTAPASGPPRPRPALRPLASPASIPSSRITPHPNGGGLSMFRIFKVMLASFAVAALGVAGLDAHVARADWSETGLDWDESAPVVKTPRPG